MAYDYYYNESWQVLEERKDGSANPYAQYVWDIRYIDAAVLRWRDTGGDPDLDETLYYCNDANMNVTALVNTSGTVVERYHYDPYGEPSFFDGSWTPRNESAFASEILYCGYRWDPETGLYVTLYRYYHPTLGRWLSRDPIGYTHGVTLYEYALSAPPARQDPFGLKILRARRLTEAVEKSLELERFGTRVNEIDKLWKEFEGPIGFLNQWRVTYTTEGPSEGNPYSKRITINLGPTPARGYANKIHEFIGGPLALWAQAEVGEAGELYGGWRAKKAGTGEDIGFATGFHNLALVMELLALAEKESKDNPECTCAHARERYKTAHVALNETATVPFQNSIKTLVDFICDCEAGKMEGTYVQRNIYYKQGTIDVEVFILRGYVKCQDKRLVDAKAVIEFYD